MSATFKKFFIKLSSILPKSCRGLKNSDGKDNLESNKSFGNKSKTGSWDEVGFLKSKDFVSESMESRLKSDILDLIEEMGMSFNDFYDLIFRADRKGCCHSLGEEFPCWDSDGEDVAYGLDAIEKAFEIKDPPCQRVCKLGCCARQNQIAYNIYRELIETRETKKNGSVN